MRLYTPVITFVLIFCLCLNANAQPMTGIRPQKHLIVYKTKKDLSACVPVLLSDDKKSVVSFPDPVDIKAAGNNAKPVHLHKGYMLSTYGIGANSAFLKTSFEEYASLPSVPAPNQLLTMIRNKKPFKMLCDCGIAGDAEKNIAELNRWIDDGLLGKKCKSLMN